MEQSPSRQDTTTSFGQKWSNIPSLACAFSASSTTGGTIYAFGIFANDLKKAMQISQMQLGAISAAFFVAGLFSWVPGLVVDRMKMRFSMAVGGISGAAFTTAFWAICRYPDFFQVAVAFPVATLSVLAVAISISCGLIVGSIFKLTLICGGPNGKGSAVGIAKAFVGLGSGIYATIFEAFRTEGESTLDFLPVIAFFFLVCTTLPALVFLPAREKSSPHLVKIETTQLHFRLMYVAVAALCLLVLGSAILDIWKTDDGTEPKKAEPGKILLVLVMWLGPIISLLYLPRKSLGSGVVRENAPLLSSQKNNPGESYTLSLSSTESQEIDEAVHAPKTKETDRLDASEAAQGLRSNLDLYEMLQTASAWVMLWVTLVLVGSGTAKTNNMGQMVESLGFSDSVTPATLTIFSVAQASSRMMTGVVSEAALQWKVYLPSWMTGVGANVGTGVPRPFFLAIASFVALVAHVLLASTTHLVSFVLGCTLSAVAFGMAWPLMVLIVGDVFGVEHVGANYMFYDGATKAIGTLLLSEYLSGNVYEAHTSSLISNAKGKEGVLACMGPDCFRDSHRTIAWLAVTCILASLVLCYQTRRSYVSHR